MQRLLQSPRPQSVFHRRRGVEILELILAFPVLLIATIAILQFFLVLIVHQTVTIASIEGARTASKFGSAGGGPSEIVASEVVSTIDEYLTVHSLAGAGVGAGVADVRVVIDDGSSSTTSATFDEGDSSIPCTPQGTAPSSTEVRVTVCFYVSQNNQPIPDLLNSFGISFADRTFEVSTLAELE